MPNLKAKLSTLRNRRRLTQLAHTVANQAKPAQDTKPVAFFITSARLQGLSQNAAFSLLTNWSLRLTGVPVKHFVCHAGLKPCVLGINRSDYHASPPCDACIAQSKRMYKDADVTWFTYQQDETLVNALKSLSTDELTAFKYPVEESRDSLSIKAPIQSQYIPLGAIVTPSIRWTLRRHTLPDDEDTRFLLRSYILSAFSVMKQFSEFIQDTQPKTAVIFNGIMYPEASARWIAEQAGVRVITHEVGFQPYSAFFTEGEATAYPIRIPDTFTLSPKQNKKLDAYLANRFQGNFTMAGIRFWPEMRSLDDKFLQKLAQFKQLVPVFTNVVYDTSQIHANKVFTNMFDWLNMLLEIIRSHPETLFVIRAHPDEMRPGTAKQSNESVHDWVFNNKVNLLPNVVFIDSQEYISSYELIQKAKFVMVYNSSIGMEATLLNAAVLCGGQARYTQYPIVFFPKTPDEYYKKAESFLEAEKVQVPPEFVQNARRFLYYQLYRTSLPFTDYIESVQRKGFVRFKPFPIEKLLPENATTMNVLYQGIVNAKPVSQNMPDNALFYLPEEE